VSTCAPMMAGLYSKTQSSSAVTYVRRLWEVVLKSVSSIHFREITRFRRPLAACSGYPNSHQGGYQISGCLLESAM
jgi:hypothetical protein